MKPNVIYIHPPPHHPDEILGAALIRVIYKDVPVISEYPPQDAFDNPAVAILDNGGKYEPDKWNLDHHQDPNLEATCLLVLDKICGDIAKKDNVRASVIDKSLRKLFTHASDVDRGIRKDFPLSITTAIRSLNNMNKEIALSSMLDMSEKIIKSMIMTGYDALTAERIWLTSPTKDGIKIILDNIKLPGWKQLAKRDGVYFIIRNGRDPGQYALVSRDSSEIAIPPHKSQVFRHNTGYMAVYSNIVDAEMHGWKLIREIKQKAEQ